MDRMIAEARRSRGRAAGAWGRAAEEQAESLYRARNAEILARRWKCRGGEIDIVAEEAGCLVFIEVKARARSGDAAGAVTPRQWQRLEAAATQYMLGDGHGLDRDCRFDLVVIDGTGSAEILENASQY